ncbi:hypothetical protein ABBQ32_007218 [Trebouxia sp. C0010 RCD-2024]
MVLRPVPQEQGKQYWEAELCKAKEVRAAGLELKAKSTHELSLIEQAATIFEDHVPQAPPSPAIAASWSDCQGLYKDIMLKIFSRDNRCAKVCNSMFKLERKVAELKDRKQKETDQDFIQLAQKKLNKANADLENSPDIKTHSIWHATQCLTATGS